MSQCDENASFLLSQPLLTMAASDTAVSTTTFTERTDALSPSQTGGRDPLSYRRSGVLVLVLVLMVMVLMVMVLMAMMVCAVYVWVMLQRRCGAEKTDHI